MVIFRNIKPQKDRIEEIHQPPESMLRLTFVQCLHSSQLQDLYPP